MDSDNNHYSLALLNGELTPGKEQLNSMLNKEGVIFTDDIPYIDVSAVILSIGPLPLAVIKKTNVLNTGRLKVAWDNSITNRMTKSTDVKLISTSAYHGVMSLGETTEEEKEPTTAEINNTDEVLSNPNSVEKDPSNSIRITNLVLS